MISFENVSKVYEDSEEKALKDLSLEIADGEFVFVVGDSGSGKSTFLRLLLRELRPTEGVIRVGEKNLSEIEDSRELAYYRRELGVVFQDFRLLSDRNVFENVALAQHVIGKGGEEIRTNVTEVLTLVGLSAKYKSYPNHLSGGEKQRVAIARALVNHPRILLADEPTGNLDPGISLEIMKILDEACRVRKTTTVVVTHDLETVRQMKKRVITLHKGVLVGDEPAPEPEFDPEAESAAESAESAEVLSDPEPVTVTKKVMKQEAVPVSEAASESEEQNEAAPVIETEEETKAEEENEENAAETETTLGSDTETVRKQEPETTEEQKQNDME